MRFGTHNSCCSAFVSIGDTLHFIGSESGRRAIVLGSDNDAATTWPSGRIGDGIDNVIRDPVFLVNNVAASGDFADSVWYRNGLDVDWSIRFEATTTVTVSGSVDKGVLSGAVCSTWNAYGMTNDHLVIQGTSDINGEVTDVVAWKYKSEDNPDSTKLDTLITHAWYDGNAGYDTTVISSTSKSIGVEVAGASGGGEFIIKQGAIIKQGTVIK